MTARNLDTGVLYCSDNLERLATLPTGTVDLIYLDPPFFSNRIYEVIWGDEAEVRSFEDRWEGGIQVYVNWMRDRVRQMYRVLRPGGVLYLHCDPHASHYLKIMLDDIFTPSGFVNEIVWQRHNARTVKQAIWPRLHDVLLYYAKGAPRTFNATVVPSTAPNDPHDLVPGPDGQRFRTSDLTGAGRRNGDTGQPWRGIDPNVGGRHWRVNRGRLDELVDEGRIYWTRSGMPRERASEPYTGERTAVVGTVWTDITSLNAGAAERLGYPTQKPESLLERILNASTRQGDVVLDPFCGCGTTISVADRLDRQYIGIDISPTAMRIMRNRMNPARVRPKIVGLPTTVDDLRGLKPFEFQNWVVEQYFGTHSPRKSNDLGIDGYTFFTADPIQVKQSDHVGRNVVDNFETAMRRGRHTKGYIVAFSFTRNSREEVARALWEDGLEIELVTVEKLAASKAEDRFPLAKDGKLIKLPTMPPPRPREALPTAEELIASDLAVAAVG